MLLLCIIPMFSLYRIQRRYREGTEHVKSIYREDMVKILKMRCLGGLFCCRVIWDDIFFSIQEKKCIFAAK